jgi:integrase
MKRSSNGSGNIYTYLGSWYVRFRVNGARHNQVLGRCSELPTRGDAERAAREILDGLPLPGESNARNTTLADFIERSYLPDAQLRRRASTYAEYRGMFQRHIKPLPESQLPLWRYRAAEVQRLLVAIAQRRSLSLTTHKHVKAFLSGVFRFAAVMGMIEKNPVRDTMLPVGSLPARETVAYTLDEIRAALAALEGDAQTSAIVAVAAFAGLRRSEIAGLRWQVYDGATLSIRETVWNSIVSPPKSKASKSWVPVIEPLRAILDRYREERERGDQFGLLTPDSRMFRFTLEHIGRKKVGEAFGRAELTFSGYHAFRRGLASNLFELGADDLTVQRILRHASVQVSREHYIKIRSAKVDSAMESLTTAYAKGPLTGLASAQQKPEVIDNT